MLSKNTLEMIDFNYLRKFFTLLLVLGLIVSCSSDTGRQSESTIPINRTEQLSDVLPSWNDGPAKRTITGYIEDVTNPNSLNFIAVADRIATFDNDGTLWSEQPLYFQFFFAMESYLSI